MNPKEEKEVKKAVLDFSKLKKIKKFSVEDEERLIYDMTNLIGTYAIDKSDELEKQIESMIEFAKKQRWAVEGSIIEFNRIRKGLLKIKK